MSDTPLIKKANGDCALALFLNVIPLKTDPFAPPVT